VAINTLVYVTDWLEKPQVWDECVGAKAHNSLMQNLINSNI